ncbi:stress-induced-phosphoprotein [Anaeramoeba flamelloides]|uniref:Stress-induced-phosphoprotein n=1 Tax=Anaeramoeba flamelloides TaxID=1746091 RepID=A0AAV8AIE2_9EUKA|nr:stress-induced-phosphoprotein [Anaeramoeba flamelloides]
MSKLRRVNRKKIIYTARFAVVSVTNLPSRSSPVLVKTRIGSHTFLTKQVLPAVNSSANLQEEFSVNSTYYRQKSKTNSKSVGSGFEYLKKPLRFSLQQDRTTNGKRLKTVTIAKAEIETTEFIGINQPILKMIRFDLKNPKKHKTTPFLIFAIQISVKITSKSIPILLHTAIQSELNQFLNKNEKEKENENKNENENSNEKVSKNVKISKGNQPKELEQILLEQQKNLTHSEEFTEYTESVSSFGSDITFLSDLSSKSTTTQISKKGKKIKKKKFVNNKNTSNSKNNVYNYLDKPNEKKRVRQLSSEIQKKKNIIIQKKRVIKGFKEAKKKMKIFKQHQKSRYFLLSSSEKELFNLKVKLSKNQNFVNNLRSKFEEMKLNQDQIEDLNEIKTYIDQLQKINKNFNNQQRDKDNNNNSSNKYNKNNNNNNNKEKEKKTKRKETKKLRKKVKKKGKEKEIKEEEEEEGKGKGKGMRKKSKMKQLKNDIEQKQMLLMRKRAQLKEINFQMNQSKTKQKKNKQKIKKLKQLINDNQEKKKALEKTIKKQNKKKKEFNNLKKNEKKIGVSQMQTEITERYDKMRNGKIEQISMLKLSLKSKIKELVSLRNEKKKQIATYQNNEILYKKFKIELKKTKKKLIKIKVNQKKYLQIKRKEIEELQIKYTERLMQENKTRIFELKKNLLISKHKFKLQQNEYERILEKRSKLETFELNDQKKNINKLQKNKKKKFQKGNEYENKKEKEKENENKKENKKEKKKENENKKENEIKKEIDIMRQKKKKKKKKMEWNLNTETEIEIIKEQKKRLKENKFETHDLYNKLQMIQNIEKEKWLIERLFFFSDEKVSGIYPIPAVILISFLIRSNSFDFGHKEVLKTYLDSLNVLLLINRNNLKKTIWLMSNIFWSIRFLLNEMKNFPEEYYLKRVLNKRFKHEIKIEDLNNNKTGNGGGDDDNNKYEYYDIYKNKVKKSRSDLESESATKGFYINFDNLINNNNEGGGNNDENELEGNEFLFENKVPLIILLYEKLCGLLDQVYLKIIYIIDDQLQPKFRQLFLKYYPSESKKFKNTLKYCTKSVINQLKLIIDYCHLTKLPNIICQGFITQAFLSINTTLFNYLLRKGEFLTIGHSAKIKESLSRIEEWVIKTPFTKSKNELNELQNLIDLILMNKVILKDQENDYFLCTNILNSISFFQIYHILSKFTTDEFDSTEIQQYELDKLLKFAQNKFSNQNVNHKIELDNTVIYSLEINFLDYNCKNWKQIKLPSKLQKEIALKLFSKN